MRCFTVSVSMFLVISVSLCHLALAEETGFPVVTASELKSKMDAGWRPFIVDVRSQEEYREGHIPGALNVPPEGYRFLPGYLPSNKTYPIVFYCRGWS